MSDHHSNPHRHWQASHAPASVAFIQQAVSPAQVSERRTGVPASVTIAQAILESGWGRHHMGNANNYFGIKAQSLHGHIDAGPVAIGHVDMPTAEYSHGQRIPVTAHFRGYASMSDSFVDHGLFLRNNHRYAQGFTAYATGGDADAFARHLQRAGYATDPHYATMLINLMKRHNLYKYDLTARK